ncbi:MBL fold metallo-hydrolase [Sphingomonas sp. PR090111-T3T-6A]|uniref:MBL fold metallo-hydrolase n=1 Tax=Sphingomonas sp. PR090111-T3T-6A TaxID=685778 RepID=UPI000369010F|nr:MBL fold metallo-hydrolase [Sphingomonas sp. PR090111-T3T-6A]
MSFRIRRTLAPLAFALLASQPLLAVPAPTPAGATGFRLGTLQLFTLRDMNNVVPNDGSVFGVGVPTPEVSKVLQQAHAPTDKISLSVDALLVRMPGHVVLLDTGLGPKVGGSLMASLAAAHVRPEEVTDILITHSHGDHVGGLATSDGALAFPKATIRMSAAEWSYMQAKGSKGLVETIRAKVQPFKPGTEVVPGITSVPLPGHTPGHSGYEIRSGSAHLLDIGDSAHSSIISLAKPDWTIEYDGDSAQGRTARKALLAKLAASHERIFAPHFPYPGVGFVEKSGDGYRWAPALP